MFKEEVKTPQKELSVKSIKLEPKKSDDQKLIKKLLVSIREYEDMIYLKEYKDIQEKNDIQAIVDNLKR